ncbi:low temperature requirement protein A [Arthrobacter zhaoguopingii]|uniref:low temperature requirement protein A n=1 Tax=Arthrobacter zhaoguopingii TaxID=2681491 RepID=UPI001356E321|nr:low temperature requirement protein A [Arthrobacter zhaoguopingii]
MLRRDPTEDHRSPSPLELLFDLTAVVAIALCAKELHHGLASGHAADSLIAFTMVFFTVWWAWMNFTWFASAYDTDDWGYRTAVFVQMSGALVLAAGVPRVFEGRGFGIVTAGYLIMRVGLISQWVRVARADGKGSRSAKRHAGGLIVLQIGWVALLAVPDMTAGMVGFFALAALELCLPFWAESGHLNRWHPRHMADRHGLFTIIVLGESILSSVIGIQVAVGSGRQLADLTAVVVGGLLIVFALWWLYFDQPAAEVASRALGAGHRQTRSAAVWGYGHFFIFASAAAVGSGLAVAVDQTTGHSELGDLPAALAITAPIALFILFVWGLHASARPRGLREAKPYIVATLVICSSWTPEPVLITGLVLTGAVVARVISGSRPSITEQQGPV